MRYTGRKGWQCSTQDAWNLDGTLMPIILAGLVKFKEMNRHGVPSKLLKNLSEEGIIGQPDENFVYSDEDIDKASEMWEEYIDTMIYAFDEKNEPDMDDFDFEIEMKSGEPEENGLIPCNIEISNEAESKRYDVASRAHKDKVERGNELFGLYFSSLWD